MSEKYVKVDTVDTVESTNSTALIVLVVAILAIAIIGLAMWQPWAVAPQSNSTTIIRTEKQVPGSDKTVIVNPPAQSAPAAAPPTNITIHNDAPPTKDDTKDTSKDTNSDSSNTDTTANNAGN